MKRFALILAFCAGLAGIAEARQNFFPLSGNVKFAPSTAAVASGGGGDVELSGLIAYFKFDENTGTTANDSAGTFVGTLQNGPTWTTGISGSALQFDRGISQYVSLSTEPVVGNRVPVSVTAWVKSTSTVAPLIVYAEGNSGTTVQRFYMGMNDDFPGDVSFGHRNDAGTDGFTETFATGSVVIDNQFHHLAVVARDGTHRDIFIDGVFRTAVGSDLDTSGAKTFTDSNIGVSQRNGSFAGYFQGVIDQVRVYDIALTTTQVQNIYTAQK